MKDGTGIDLSEDDLRAVARFAAACAWRALPVFEARHPGDERPRNAIAATDAFGAGEKRSAALRAAAWAAYSAARDVPEAAAGNAARAASLAAAAAFLHPVASPHQVKHVLGAAVHHALALELDAEADAGLGEAHINWAIGMASPSVRSVLRRLPPPRSGRGRFGVLLGIADARLRG